MSSEDESVTVTLKVAAELERLGVDYFVGGSVASSVHGRPRTTDDVDVVVVGMIRNVNGSRPIGGSPQVRPLSRKLVYQALVDRKN